MWLSYEHLARSNYVIARLRAPLSESVLYHEKGSSIGAFNSVSITSREVVLGLNFYPATSVSVGNVALRDMVVSAWSSPDAGIPLTDVELEERICNAHSAYSSNSQTDPQSVARLCIDVWADEPGTVADNVANQVFSRLHTTLGGCLLLAPTFQFSDIYPRGINAEQSFFVDEGRRIAELEFATPITEADLRVHLGILDDHPILGGDGTQLNVARFSVDAWSVHLVARQF